MVAWLSGVAMAGYLRMIEKLLETAFNCSEM